MSANNDVKLTGDDGQLRDVQESDIGGSEPSRGLETGLSDPGVQPGLEYDQPISTDGKKANTSRNLAQEIRDEYSNSFVLVDKQSGEVLAVEDSTQGILESTRHVDVPSSRLLTVNCYE